MITAYHRPQTLDEALALLARPNTVPLGGGTLLSRPTADPVEVVDLQALGLNSIKKKGSDPSTLPSVAGQRLEIGATVTLQELFESKDCPEALRVAIKFEAPLNIRNSATVAGTLVASDGRSTFATAILALDAKIDIRSTKKDARTMAIGEFLLTRPRGLITSITIPFQKFAFESVSRTPADKPIVCAALSQWSSGRTRLALGGYGKSPLLAMDGTEVDGLEAATRNAYHEANDDWASAEYRMDIAATLAKRCLEKFGS